MERKEHPVPVIKKGGEVLEFLDSEGNPFKPSGSVKYQLVGEDDSVLSEGTIDEDSNKISLSGISSKTFKVILDGHFIVEIDGAETPEEESDGPVEQIDELVIPPSSSDPDDELTLPEDFDAEQPAEPETETDSEENEDDEAENQSSDSDDSENESDDADKDADEKDSGDDDQGDESSDQTQDDESSNAEQPDKTENEETSDSDKETEDENDG